MVNFTTQNVVWLDLFEEKCLNDARCFNAPMNQEPYLSRLEQSNICFRITTMKSEQNSIINAEVLVFIFVRTVFEKRKHFRQKSVMNNHEHKTKQNL